MYRKDSRSDGSGLCGNKGSEAILKGIVVVSIYGKTESYPQTKHQLDGIGIEENRRRRTHDKREKMMPTLSVCLSWLSYAHVRKKKQGNFPDSKMNHNTKTVIVHLQASL